MATETIKTREQFFADHGVPCDKYAFDTEPQYDTFVWEGKTLRKVAGSNVIVSGGFTGILAVETYTKKDGKVGKRGRWA